MGEAGGRQGGRAIWVDSNSSCDSMRSRHAKNLVDAKKLGSSEELCRACPSPHSVLFYTQWLTVIDTRLLGDIMLARLSALPMAARHKMPSTPSTGIHPSCAEVLTQPVPAGIAVCREPGLRSDAIGARGRAPLTSYRQVPSGCLLCPTQPDGASLTLHPSRGDASHRPHQLALPSAKRPSSTATPLAPADALLGLPTGRSRTVACSA